MKISIITPSFNQGQFLPYNLKSVASQTHRDVEHIVVDPGSTDDSRNIASSAGVDTIFEPDRGQSDGITKGYSASQGEIIAWLNSDDMLADCDALAKVAAYFASNPATDILLTNVDFVDDAGAFIKKGFVNNAVEGILRSFHQQVGVVQPGVFMRRKIFEALGGPSEEFEYCMDYEYWVRIADAGFKYGFLDARTALHRWWDGMKTASSRGESYLEHFKVCHKYFGYIHWKWLERYAEFLSRGDDGIIQSRHRQDKRAFNEDSVTGKVINRYMTDDMLAFIERQELAEHSETLEFVRRYTPRRTRKIYSLADLRLGPRLPTGEPDADQKEAWHIFRREGSDGARYLEYTVPDNFSRAIAEEDHVALLASSRVRLSRVRAAGERACVIVANGPSLNNTDFSLLEGRDLIISNFAVLNPFLRDRAKMVTVTNDLVARQGAVDFNGLDLLKVAPFWLAGSLSPDANTAFVDATVRPKFNASLSGVFSWRSTVSFFNMQLAVALGYRSIALIGFDHSYQQPEGAKEGDLIKQTRDDANHFDPRYFKGKSWQAADVTKMEAMYRLAEEEAGNHGASIVNATAGGKLEVFPRVSLADFAANADGQAKQSAQAGVPAPPDKLLLIDFTKISAPNATGAIKQALLGGYPGEILQIYQKDSRQLGALRLKGGQPIEDKAVTPGEAWKMTSAFSPKSVLIRPVEEAPEVRAFMLRVASSTNWPIATWIMDDWLARARRERPESYTKLKSEFDLLVGRSGGLLAISDAMADMLASTYKKRVFTVANGIDPEQWRWDKKKPGSPFTLRYAGSLAPNMTASSVMRVASAVERLGDKFRFEIQTSAYWRAGIESQLQLLPQTHVFIDRLDDQAYRMWLSDADALLIAYNFDDASKDYVRYSLANKLPECLASGRPVFAHGPAGLATIDYLAGTNAAVLIKQPSVTMVSSALQALAADTGSWRRIGDAGRRLATHNHNLNIMTARLYSALHASFARSMEEKDYVG